VGTSNVLAIGGCARGLYVGRVTGDVRKIIFA
jgi:hypothetical protein